MSARSSEGDCVRPRYPVYLEVLEASPGGPRHQAHLQHSLSPADWRPDRASEPDTAGYATRMCSSLWLQMGGLLALCRILLQQQLPVKFADGPIRSTVRTEVPHTPKLVPDR